MVPLCLLISVLCGLNLVVLSDHLSILVCVHVSQQALGHRNVVFCKNCCAVLGEAVTTGRIHKTHSDQHNKAAVFERISVCLITPFYLNKAEKWLVLCTYRTFRSTIIFFFFKFTSNINRNTYTFMQMFNHSGVAQCIKLCRYRPKALVNIH